MTRSEVKVTPQSETSWNGFHAGSYEESTVSPTLLIFVVSTSAVDCLEIYSFICAESAIKLQQNNPEDKR